jgi:hypothetical protein
MTMLARISPKSRAQKLLYIRADDNDDFLRNYLYCSKPSDVAVPASDAVCAEPCTDTKGGTMCAEINTEMCCVSFFPDSTIGQFLSTTSSRRQATQHGPLLSLSGNQPSYSRMEPETWFDVASERFDEVFDHLAGSATRNGTQWTNVSFQAPILKKTSSQHGGKPLQVTSMALEDDAEGILSEEKKIDNESDNHHRLAKRTSKHVRHLSHPHAPESPLSDNQFELIYGIPREEFADSVSRNFEKHYYGLSTAEWSSLITTTGDGGGVINSDPFQDIQPLFHNKDLERERQRRETEADFDPIVINPTY